MRHEQYTCDRCHEKISGSPKHHGPWTFSIGHYCVMKREMFGSGHLCDECFNHITAAMEAFWKALFPKLRHMKAALPEVDDDVPL